MLCDDDGVGTGPTEEVVVGTKNADVVSFAVC